MSCCFTLEVREEVIHLQKDLQGFGKKKGTYSPILLGLFYGLKPAQSRKSKENRNHCAQHQHGVFSGKTVVGSPKEHSGFCGTDRAANT